MKRRILSILLSLTMMFTLVPTAWAEDTEAGTASVPELENSATEGTSGGIDWKVEGGFLTISAANSPKDGYNAGQMKDYTSQMGETVTDPTEWYALKDSISEIKIEEGVTYLGNWAFSGLTSVVKANIPASITGLGNHIFRGDTALTTVEWASDFNAPEIIDTDSKDKIYSGNYVPTSMFDGCTSLGSGEELSAWLPDSFTGVGCAAFRGTQFTVDFDVWDNLTYIGAYGFAGMPNLDSFTLSNEIMLGLRGGASNAFNSSGLKSLTVADGIEAIPSGLCDGCEQLSSVLADSVKTIATNAFRNTKALKAIDLKKVQAIGGYAFQGSGLTDLVLPKSVETVESRAFEACTSLTKVTINAAGLTLDNRNTFAGCSSLNTVVTSAGSKINGLNTGAFGPDSHGSYVQAPVESIEINGTVNTLNFSTLASLKNLTINGKNNLTSGALPSGFENLVINGASWSVGHYQFQSTAPVKHLVVSAAEVSDNSDNAGKTEAAFRSNFNLETAQFTGTTVKLQAKMFMGCTSLNWLDLSAVGTLTVGSGCFGDDTNPAYGASMETPNKFNEDCVIYAKDATAAQTLRGNGSGLGTKGIVLIVNGGTVDVTAATAGFGAVSKSDCTAKWYEYDSTITEDSGYSSKTIVTTPEIGKTYIAIWTDCSHNTKAYTASGAVLTESCADCGRVFGTATVAAPANLTYDGSKKECTIAKSSEWKDTSELTVAYYSDEKELDEAPVNAGNYTAKVTVQGATASVNFTITQAKPTIAISADPTSLTGSGTVKLTVTSKGVPTDGKIKVTCDNGINVTENEDGISATLPNATKTYTFTASYNGDANHKEAFGTCQVSVTRRSSSGGSSSSDRSYAVSAPSTKNGDVTVSPKNAAKGDRVTVTVTPDKGYELDSLTVKDVSGNKLKLTDKGNGKYTFTMPGSKVTVSAEFVEEQAASIFADVPADAYYAKAVEWAVKKGITNGKANGLFGSNDPCTRGQIVTFLWRAAGSPAPKGTAKVPADVLPGSYCYDAVAWALENGITNGLADGTFGVNNTCTRGQSVTFLYRAMGTAPTTVNGFTDVAADSFCAEAVAWAVENGVTNGTSASTFSPSNGCTRAQIVTFLFRTYQGK